MRKPQGYGVINDPDKGVFERDTFTCAHCQKIVAVPPKADAADMGGWCFKCDKMICPGCAEFAQRNHNHMNWEEQMAKMEARERFRRSLS